jgi:hypothetical protein
MWKRTDERSEFMKVATSLLLILLLCSVFIPGVSAQVEDTPMVRGIVVNNTLDGTIPFGAAVTLQFFSESEWTSIYTSTLTTNGTFTFTDLEGEVGHDFITRLEYSGVEYYSEPTVLEGQVDVEIVIYEPTEDSTQVKVDQAHFFIVPNVETLQIAEYYLIGNAGDRTYAGMIDALTGERITVRFSPPAGATDLTFDGPGFEGRFVGNPEQFADTRAVPPGNATIDVSYSYELPLTEDIVIEHTFEIPVSSVVMIVSGGELGLQGPALQFSGIMDTQMGPAASYTTGPLAPYETLSFTVIPLAEQPTQGSEGAQSSPLLRQRNARQELGVGIVTLLIAGVVAFQIWQAPSRIKMPEELQPLVQQIADLDVKFDEDKIEKTEYQAQRKLLKRRIRETLSKS